MKINSAATLVGRLWCGVVGILLWHGCQAGDAPPLGAVTGVVTLNGEPLENAIVLFSLEQGGRPAAGVTQKDGHYRLDYTGTQGGAPVGLNVVRISTGKEGNSTAPEVPEQLPSKYHSQSELTAVVNAGKNKIDFALEGPLLSSKAKKGNPQNQPPETQPAMKD